MRLQRPIYDVIIGNFPGDRPPDRPEKEWKPEDNVAADGLLQERTDTQAGMAVTRAQAKRDKQTKRQSSTAWSWISKSPKKNGRNSRRHDLDTWLENSQWEKAGKIYKDRLVEVSCWKGFPSQNTTKIRPKHSEAVAGSTATQREGYGHRSRICCKRSSGNLQDIQQGHDAILLARNSRKRAKILSIMWRLPMIWGQWKDCKSTATTDGVYWQTFQESRRRSGGNNRPCIRQW